MGPVSIALGCRSDNTTPANTSCRSQGSMSLAIQTSRRSLSDSLQSWSIWAREAPDEARSDLRNTRPVLWQPARRWDAAAILWITRQVV